MHESMERIGDLDLSEENSTETEPDEIEARQLLQGSSVRDDTTFWDRLNEEARAQVAWIDSCPRLDRAAEIRAAQRIETARKRYRRTVFESGYALSHILDALSQVEAGELPLHEVARISAEDSLENEYLRQRIPEILTSLRPLFRHTYEDFSSSLQPGLPCPERLELAHNLSSRRRECALLIEVLNIHRQKVEFLMRDLVAMSERMEELQRELAQQHPRECVSEWLADAPADENEERAELHELMFRSLETPATLQRRGAKLASLHAGYEQGRKDLVDPHLRLVVAVVRLYLAAGEARGLSVQHLIKAGSERLWAATDHYDWQSGYRFASYALHWVRSGITRAIEHAE